VNGAGRRATTRAGRTTSRDTWPRKRPANGSTTRADRVNYGDPAHAGQPHKGRITDAEKELVRERFDQINERLAAQGTRTISLADPEHVDRYGLEELARSRGVKPE
jgi:hypothetical protein